MPSPAGLVVKKGLNIFSFTSGRNSGAVVTDADLDAVTEALRSGREGRLIGGRSISLPSCFSLCRGIETVGDQVQEGRFYDLLREKIDLSGLRDLLISSKGDVELPLLRARPVIGEIEALLDERVDVWPGDARRSPPAHATACS